MKKIILSLLVVAFVIPAFVSCKKGENDPFISLKTRKARLTGDWALTAGSVTETDDQGNFTVTSFDGDYKTVSGIVKPTVYTENYSILKDGTFTSTRVEGSTTYTYEGTWYFGGKSETLDLKNKESVVFIYTKVSSVNGTTTDTKTYSGNEAAPSFTWIIDQLKSDEIIIKLDGANSDAGTILGMDYSSSSTFTGTKTYSAK